MSADYQKQELDRLKINLSFNELKVINDFLKNGENTKIDEYRLIKIYSEFRKKISFLRRLFNDSLFLLLYLNINILIIIILFYNCPDKIGILSDAGFLILLYIILNIIFCVFILEPKLDKKFLEWIRDYFSLIDEKKKDE